MLKGFYIDIKIAKSQKRKAFWLFKLVFFFMESEVLCMEKYCKMIQCFWKYCPWAVCLVQRRKLCGAAVLRRCVKSCRE